MGLPDLSMNPVALLEAKTVIRSIVYEEWQSIAEMVSRLSSFTEIKEFLPEEYDRRSLLLPDAGRPGGFS